MKLLAPLSLIMVYWFSRSAFCFRNWMFLICEKSNFQTSMKILSACMRVHRLKIVSVRSLGSELSQERKQFKFKRLFFQLIYNTFSVHLLIWTPNKGDLTVRTGQNVSNPQNPRPVLSNLEIVRFWGGDEFTVALHKKVKPRPC